MLKEAFSNVDEIKIMEMYIVVLSGNDSYEVLLYKSIHIVLYGLKVDGGIVTQCQAMLLRIHC